MSRLRIAAILGTFACAQATAQTPAQLDSVRKEFCEELLNLLHGTMPVAQIGTGHPLEAPPGLTTPAEQRTVIRREQEALYREHCLTIKGRR